MKTVQLDPSGTGTDFLPVKFSTSEKPFSLAHLPFFRGDPVHGFRRIRLPLYTHVAQNLVAVSQKLSVQIPSGIKCIGGTSKNLCLASFATTSGFGNCVVVSQGAGAADQATLVNGVAKGIRAGNVSAAKGDHNSPSKKPKMYDAPKKFNVSKIIASKKVDASENDAPSKRVDASKKPAAPKKTVAPKLAPHNPQKPKKNDKINGNTHERNCKCRPLGRPRSLRRSHQR